MAMVAYVEGGREKSIFRALYLPSVKQERREWSENEGGCRRPGESQSISACSFPQTFTPWVSEKETVEGKGV
jgi:hypothetical protein